MLKILFRKDDKTRSKIFYVLKKKAFQIPRNVSERKGIRKIIILQTYAAENYYHCPDQNYILEGRLR